MVLPSLEGLRSSIEIQDQVDARIKDLQNSNDKGKLKSQRGGGGGGGTQTVFVKKEILWSQNYILGGTNKSRVTYDSLSISQWVSGFTTIIKDEQNAKLSKTC